MDDDHKQPCSSAFYRGYCSRCNSFPVATLSFFTFNVAYEPNRCISCLLEVEFAQCARELNEKRLPTYCHMRLLDLLKQYRRIASGFEPLDGDHPKYIHGAYFETHRRADAFYCDELCPWATAFYERVLRTRRDTPHMQSVVLKEPFSSQLWYSKRGACTKMIWVAGGETIALLTMDYGKIKDIDGLFEHVRTLTALIERIFCSAC